MSVVATDDSISVAGSTVSIYTLDQLESVSNVTLRNRQFDLIKLLDLAKHRYMDPPSHKSKKIQWILDMQEALVSKSMGPIAEPRNATAIGVAPNRRGPSSPFDDMRRTQSPFAQDFPNTAPGGRSPMQRNPGPAQGAPARADKFGGAPARADKFGSPRPFSPSPQEIRRAEVTREREEVIETAKNMFRSQSPVQDELVVGGLVQVQQASNAPRKLTEFQLDQLGGNRLLHKCIELKECLDLAGKPYSPCPGSRAGKIKWILAMQELLADVSPGRVQVQGGAAGILSEYLQLTQPAPKAGNVADKRLVFEPPNRGPSPPGMTGFWNTKAAPPRVPGANAQQMYTSKGFAMHSQFPMGGGAATPPPPLAAPITATIHTRRRGAPKQAVKPGIKRQSLLAKQQGSPHVHYTVLSRLGEGAFGVTDLVKHKATQHQRCLKTVNKIKAQVPPEILDQEFQALALVDHPHIIKLFEYYEDNMNVYFITEAYKGGTLLDVVEAHRKIRKRIDEDWLAAAFQQILEGLAYCHSRNLMHKDLKAENIMLLEKDDGEFGVHAVIIDLGLSEVFAVDGGHDVAGTPITMAPELWRAAMGNGSFGSKCDIYSLGCVLFRTLSNDGIPPIVPTGRGEPSDWLRAIRRGPDWNQIRNASPDAKSLATSMLTYEEEQRPDALKCLQHPWFQRARATTDTIELKDEHLNALLDGGNRGRAQTGLHQNVLMKVASQLGAAELRDVNAVFRRYDVDNSGELSCDEVVSMLMDLGVSEEAAAEAAFTMDISGDGIVDYTEFVTACVSHRKEGLRKLLKQAFDQYDTNGDGTLSADEVYKVLTGDKMPRELHRRDADANVVLDQLMFDQYGAITFDEFAELFIPS